MEQEVQPLEVIRIRRGYEGMVLRSGISALKETKRACFLSLLFTM